MNINANKFGQPAILASKQCSLLTVSRGVSVKHARTGHLRIADADGKMRMEKCGKNKTRNADGKNKQTNKQTKERNLSFKVLSHGWALHVQYALSIVGTGYSWFFSQFFEPCNSFY